MVTERAAEAAREENQTVDRTEMPLGSDDLSASILSNQPAP